MVKRRSAVATVVLVVLGLSALPAAAAAPDSAGDRPSKPGARGSAEVRLALGAASGTQTQAEIDDMMASGQPVEVLWDLETETFLAAVWVHDGDVSSAAWHLDIGERW